MMLQRKLGLVIAVFTILASLDGCAINRATATVDQTTDLSTLKVFYVKKYSKDTRDTDVLIADRLRAMGFKVSDKEADVDATVTYVDKWFWDITWYLLELTITLRDPKTDFPLASGNSLHTSLARRTPEEMVDEVLTNIFSGKQKLGVGNAK